MLLGTWLADLALRFGPPEYFALLCVGLSLVMGLAGKSLTLEVELIEIAGPA